MPDLYTRVDVEAFLHRPSYSSKQPQGKAVSAHSWNQRLGILRAFYKFARDYTITGKEGEPVLLMQRADPTRGIIYKDTPRKYRALSFEEFERLFNVIPTDTVQGLRDRAIFLFYFWTARRRSEIARLRWGNIEHSSAVDSGLVYRFYGKGHSTQEDISELPRGAYQALVAYLKASGRYAHMTADSPLFIWVHRGGVGSRDMADEHPLGSRSMCEALKKYAVQAGIDDRKITLHSLRHTAAQQRLAAGEKILDIKRLLRHQNLNTTQRYIEGLMGTDDPGAKLLEEKFTRFSEGGN